MSLDELRRQVDDIDRALVDLLSRRAETALKIGAEKRRQGAAIHDPDREDAVRQHVRDWNRGPLSGDELERIFQEIMAGCTRLQQRMREASRG